MALAIAFPLFTCLQTRYLENGALSASTPYEPRSPYSASKAAGDHLVSAWRHTFGLPAIIVHASNNYGPFQFPEKLVALMIVRALARDPLPIYGDGMQVRDWLHVEDHIEALMRIAQVGESGDRNLVGRDPISLTSKQYDLSVTSSMR